MQYVDVILKLKFRVTHFAESLWTRDGGTASDQCGFFHEAGRTGFFEICCIAIWTSATWHILPLWKLHFLYPLYYIYIVRYVDIRRATLWGVGREIYVQVDDPKCKPLIKRSAQKYRVVLTANQGVYKFCFSNPMSNLSSKVVHFSLQPEA